MTGQIYTLRMKNRTTSRQNFVVYQQGLNASLPNVSALAWLAHPVASGADVEFTWTTDHQFIWSTRGQITESIAFKSQQVVPTDLLTNNVIEFSLTDGAFGFANQSGPGPQGTLTIRTSSDVPRNTAMIGVAMAGSAVFTIPAEPNFSAVFTPHPEYWIAADNSERGQALSVESASGGMRVNFPPDVYGMTATLAIDYTWSLQQGLV